VHPYAHPHPHPQPADAFPDLRANARRVVISRWDHGLELTAGRDPALDRSGQGPRPEPPDWRDQLARPAGTTGRRDQLARPAGAGNS